MKDNLMKAAAAISVLCLIDGHLGGQDPVNTADRLMQEESRFSIGGYGQVDYNQGLDKNTHQTGKLDVHRLVLMFGYKFNEKTQFITELEFEHVKEVYVEQAFLQYEILPWLKFRGGLMLVPMGIINEYHEPSTFNGVERPNLDKYIVPTTWREIGAGFTGVFPGAALSCQLYLMNGFLGYDGSARLSGSDGFRKGRQKGAESLIHNPGLALKLNYSGIAGLQLGVSGYSGKTQSTLYDGIDRSDALAVATADSSAVGLNMAGIDARYTYEGFRLSAQANYGLISNSSEYNTFTGSDLGSTLSGWYTELAYNLFHTLERLNSELIPFIRYEEYHTHAGTEDVASLNPANNRSDLTLGIGWKMAQGAMLKLDYQQFRNRAGTGMKQQINAGVAVWF